MDKLVEVKLPAVELKKYMCPKCGKRLVRIDIQWCPDGMAGCNVNHHVYHCCYGCGKYWQTVQDKETKHE